MTPAEKAALAALRALLDAVAADVNGYCPDCGTRAGGWANSDLHTDPCTVADAARALNGLPMCACGHTYGVHADEGCWCDCAEYAARALVAEPEQAATWLCGAETTIMDRVKCVRTLGHPGLHDNGAGAMWWPPPAPVQPGAAEPERPAFATVVQDALDEGSSLRVLPNIGRAPAGASGAGTVAFPLLPYDPEADARIDAFMATQGATGRRREVPRASGAGAPTAVTAPAQMGRCRRCTVQIAEAFHGKKLCEKCEDAEKYRAQPVTAPAQEPGVVWTVDGDGFGAVAHGLWVRVAHDRRLGLCDMTVHGYATIAAAKAAAIAAARGGR